MEENIDRLYHYRFSGIEQPITILAHNRTDARRILKRSNLPKQYQGKELESETTSQPLVGITTMQDGSKTLVWVGRSEKSPSGWEEKK